MWVRCFLRDASIEHGLAIHSSPIRQIVFDVMQPPALRPSSPSFSRHLHHHHSLCFFSSQYMPMSLTRIHCIPWKTTNGISQIKPVEFHRCKLCDVETRRRFLGVDRCLPSKTASRCRFVKRALAEHEP